MYVTWFLIYLSCKYKVCWNLRIQFLVDFVPPAILFSQGASNTCTCVWFSLVNVNAYRGSITAWAERYFENGFRILVEGNGWRVASWFFFLITESNYKYISLHKYEVGKLEFMEATSISTLGKQILQIKKSNLPCYWWNIPKPSNSSWTSLFTRGWPWMQNWDTLVNFEWNKHSYLSPCEFNNI